MSQILPGVYPDIRSGDLAIARPVSLNVLGLVGTANRGTVDSAILISSIQKAYETYGFPDAFSSSSEMQELTLSRGIQIAFDAGASSIYAVRVASASAEKATRDIVSASGTCVMLSAATEGAWGNDLQYLVEIADGDTGTDYHTDKHFGYVEDSYTDALTLGSPFSYLSITSAINYYAEGNQGNSVRAIYDSGSGVAVDMTLIHSDAHVFQESSEVNGENITVNTMWTSQTFTVIDACTIIGVRLRLKESVATLDGNLNVAVKAVDTTTGKPTGANLAIWTGTCASLTLTSSYSTEELTFTASYALIADTKYAIVIYRDTASAGTLVVGGFTADGTDTYTKGDGWYSTDSGATWGASTSCEDYMFDTIITIPENNCEFVISNWGTTYPSAHKKHIRWSGTSTPTDTTYAYVNYFTSTSRKVTVKYGTKEEYYWIVDGDDLVVDVTAGSTLVTATADTYSSEEPSTTVTWQNFGLGAGTAGNNGAIDSTSGDYITGLTALESHYIHVISCPGRSDRATISALTTHVTNMSKPGIEHERVAVAGHAHGFTLDQVLSFSGPFANKRLVLVTPGIEKTNVATGDIEELPASYSGTYLAGYLCSGDISESNLFKMVNTSGLEIVYTRPELEQIVQRRIDPIAQLAEGGYKWHESLTTSTDTEWQEITVVRIVDYATYGLRSICRQFIGRKNLRENRSAIRNAVIKFFDDMVAKQMLSTTDGQPYSADVTATREDETMGKVKVIVSFKPVLAIKYIDLIEYVK